MKAFLGGLGIAVSITLSAFIYFWPMQRPALSQSPQVLGETIDLTEYFSQKGQVISSSSASFGKILNSPPLASSSAQSSSSSSERILTASESATASAKTAQSPPIRLKKSSYMIAVLGDSMVDTLGPGVPHLANKLRAIFPGIKFTVLNYGVGASNIEYGLERLNNDYTYLNEYKPALLSQNPDVLVVESFAYNHWNNTKSDLDRQWITISKIIETVKSKNPNTKIILSASVAPYCPTYTDGSANLPPERKQIECETVKAYLQNMVNFSTSQKFPLADAFHASLKGYDGNPKYINSGDHIHPSDLGKALFAEKVTQAFIILESIN